MIQINGSLKKCPHGLNPFQVFRIKTKLHKNFFLDQKITGPLLLSGSFKEDKYKKDFKLSVGEINTIFKYSSELSKSLIYGFNRAEYKPESVTIYKDLLQFTEKPNKGCLECAIDTEFHEIESIVNDCRWWYVKNREIIINKEIQNNTIGVLSDDEKLAIVLYTSTIHEKPRHLNFYYQLNERLRSRTDLQKIIRIPLLSSICSQETSKFHWHCLSWNTNV